MKEYILDKDEKDNDVNNNNFYEKIEVKEQKNKKKNKLFQFDNNFHFTRYIDFIFINYFYFSLKKSLDMDLLYFIFITFNYIGCNNIF